MTKSTRSGDKIYQENTYLCKKFKLVIMMKYLFPFIAVLALFACSSNPEEELPSALARVNVKCEVFGYSIEDIGKVASAKSKSRGISLAAGNLTKLNFTVFDENGKVVYSEYQTSSSENFGKITSDLRLGNYTLVAVARNGMADGQFNIKSPTEAASTINRIFDTFCATQSVSITSDNEHNVTMDLDRAVCLFTLRQTKAIPDTVKSIKFYFNTQHTVKELPDFNPTTKVALGNYQISREASLVNHEPQDLNFYAFLPANSTTVNIKVEALDESGNVVISHDFNNVTMQICQRTIASGDMFSGSFGASFTVNTDWLPDVIIPF